MSSGHRWKRKDVSVRRDGDVLVITLDGATWRIRTTLSPEGVTLTDADTGTVLCAQDLASIGIRYRDGTYLLEEDGELEQFLTAFAIAWIMLHPRH